MKHPVHLQLKYNSPASFHTSPPSSTTSTISHSTMSHPASHNNKSSDQNTGNSTPSSTMPTHRSIPCPPRRPSPPLSELFPEYYESIEPESWTQSCGPDSACVGSRTLEIEQEIALFDREDEAHPSLQQQYRIPSTAESRSARLQVTPKHHCLLAGHIFKHYRISRLPPQAEIDGLDLPDEYSKHKQEDLKVWCMVCRRRIDEHLWKCEVGTCLREVCGGCRERI